MEDGYTKLKKIISKPFIFLIFLIVTGWIKPMKYEGDAVKNTLKYLDEVAENKEAPVKELQGFFEKEELIGEGLFLLKLDKRGNRLSNILKRSKLFEGELKYSKKYKAKLIHWKLK